MDWIQDILLPSQTPTMVQSMVVLMLAIGSGVFVGRLKIGRISLGVAAVMFTGLFLGHYGYRMQGDVLEFVRELGLIFFVYGIGLQVGPSFFSSFKSEGLKFNLLAISTVLLGGVITYLLYLMVELPMESLVGIMSGAVTNTPGLGAATSTLEEIKQMIPDKKFVDPAIGYAITYPLGVFGIIVTVILTKSIFKVDLNQEMRKFRLTRIDREEPLIQEKIRVTKDEYVGQSLYEILSHLKVGVVVSRLKHSGDDKVEHPTLDMRIKKRDVLMLVGLASEIEIVEKALGRKSSDSFIESDSEVVSKILYVTNKRTVYKTLSQLDLFNTYDVKVTRIYRAGQQMLARPSFVLYYGDAIRVVGKADAIKKIEKIIGNSEKQLIEPDLLSLFGGLLLGIIVGSIPLFVPGLPVPIKLGFAAGPLIVALLLSRYGGLKLIHPYLDNGATNFMKDMGICLFFAAVGIHAGENFYDNFVKYNGWIWLLYGSAITFVPLIFMFIVGKYVMKINFLQLAGLMSGSYTDPAALSFSTSYLESDVPVQSYAQIYPMVTIFRIFVAQLLILMFA